MFSKIKKKHGFGFCNAKPCFHLNLSNLNLDMNH